MNRSFSVKASKIPLWCLLAHLIIGVSMSEFVLFSKIMGVLPLLLLGYHLVKQNTFEAILLLFYYSSLELALRMTGGSIGYEFCKYLVIGASIFIILNEGVVARQRIFILAIILLLVSFIEVDYSDPKWVNKTLFSVAGILALFSSAALLRDRRLSKNQHRKILAAICLPILVSLIIVIIKTPDFALINFRSHSSFATSGQFGPVHVSTIFGAAMSVLAISIVLKKPLFYNRLGDIVLLCVLVFRGLLTFSRSGISITLLALTAALPTLRIFSRLRTNFVKVTFGLLAVTFLIQIVWTQVVNLTDGMARNRFSGKDSAGNRLDDISGERRAFVFQELEMFSEEKVLGIGPGNTASVRSKMFGVDNATSHTEYTRLLAEHGIFGGITLIILIGFPVLHFRMTRGITRVWFVLLCSFSLISMITTSTRTTLPLIFYGLSLTTIYEPNKRNSIRKDHG